MSNTFPVLIAEAIDLAIDGRDRFPFRSWAAASRFSYPEDATEFLSHCGSAAEAFFAREFLRRSSGITYGERSAHADNGNSLTLQERAAKYRIDAVAESNNQRVAVEIDGMQWHSRTQDQIAADYIRQRRIVLVGYTVIRFTAKEVFGDPAECWRQVEIILARRGKGA